MWPQTPTPHFIFYILREEPLGNHFLGLFVLEDPSSPPNKLAKDVYLCGLSKAREKKNVFDSTTSKAILLNGCLPEHKEPYLCPSLVSAPNLTPTGG